MNSVKISAIIALSALATILVVILCYGISFGGTADGGQTDFYSECSLVQEEEFPAEEIDSLRIRYRSFMSVIFLESPGETVIVKEYMNFTPGERQLSAIEKKDSSLVVEGARTNFLSHSFFSMPRGYAEIYLPSELYASLSSLQVLTVSGDIRSEIPFTLSGSLDAASTSGDISFSSAEAGKISVSNTSGEIRLESARGTSLRLSTTSGDITAQRLCGDTAVSTTSGEIRIGGAEEKLQVSSVSGDIRLEALNAPFRLSTTSGEIVALGGCGFGEANSVSGDIRLLLDDLSGGLALHTTSGDVILTLPGTASFSLKYSSTSGNCATFFDDVLSFGKGKHKADGQYGDTPEYLVRVSTTSGDLRVTDSLSKGE